MDGARGALSPIAKGFRLRGIEARWDAVSCRGEMGEGTPQKSSDGVSLWEEKACLDCLITKNRPEMRSQRLVELSTISHGSTIYPYFNVQFFGYLTVCWGHTIVLTQ